MPFGRGRSTISVAIWCVCRALANYLGQKYIRMPETVEEMQESIAKFLEKHRFSQAFGAIDCTHIDILQPVKNSTDFIN